MLLYVSVFYPYRRELYKCYREQFFLFRILQIPNL